MMSEVRRREGESGVEDLHDDDDEEEAKEAVAGREEEREVWDAAEGG